MKRLFVVFLGLLFLNIAFTQVTVNTTVHDFGELAKNDKKFYDLSLTNTGPEKVLVLRVEKPEGITARLSKTEILPDSTIMLRVNYTPYSKGKFKKEILVWLSTSNQPLVLTLTGDVTEIDENEALACPDFSVSATPGELITKLKVKVIDELTQLPIEDAEVKIIWHGMLHSKETTDKKGEAIPDLRWDIYYFVVSAEGYQTKEKDFYVNRQNNYVEFELRKIKEEEKPVLVNEPVEEITIVVAQEPVEEIVAVVEEESVEVEISEEEVTEVEVVKEKIQVVIAVDTISTAELPVDLYAPNNVVFCVDVSVSMKQKGRLDLLEASMIELLNGLRPIDKLAIVAYSTKATVIMESQYVTDKEKIMELIQSLSAGGSTAGDKGIKKAFQVAQKNKIGGGNNQVIIATDGAFYNTEGILKNVTKNLEKGVTISVVGVKNDEWTVKSMTSIADTGAGNYLHIESYEQAQPVLLEEIKTNSRK